MPVDGEIMNKDQAIGAGLTVGSIAVLVVYAYLLFFTEYSVLVLKLTALIAVGAVMGILAWIGYTLATTPPPKPIEEIEKEIEEELKKLEQELKEQEGKEGTGEGEKKEGSKEEGKG
jgi:predicted DNA-binding transcriptional regulator